MKKPTAVLLTALTDHIRTPRKIFAENVMKTARLVLNPTTVQNVGMG